MGGREEDAQVFSEPSVKYHPYWVRILTLDRNPAKGQCYVGSLTGAVSSQKVTEESKGILNTVGNRVKNVKA